LLFLFFVYNFLSIQRTKKRVFLIFPRLNFVLDIVSHIRFLYWPPLLLLLL